MINLTGKKLSLLTCGLLLSSSMAFGASTIDEAFKSGTVSGGATLYGIDKDAKGGTADSDDAFATFSLSYETASYKNLSVKTSFIAGHAFDDSNLAENAIMTEAYVKYAVDGFSLSVGRQAIDLEWLGDYNEAVVAAITSVPDTTIVAGYVNEQAAADEDEINAFDEVTKDGAYVLDVKYSGISNVELNPYYYSAPDVANFYGLKASYNSDAFGAVAHYAASSEDTQKDGSIGHVELSTTLAGLSLAAGYIKAGDDVGAGSISAYGDNISPFDEGANTYSAKAESYYASLGYSVAGIDLGALYGQTEFGANSEETELNLTAGYSITDSLGLSLLYVDYDLDGSSNSDFNSISATLAYSF